MKYSLSLGAINLAPDSRLGGEQLEWTDKYEWDAIEQTQKRSLGGALIVQEGTKRYGRPITLASGEDGAWFSRSTIDALEALRDQPSTPMLLTLPGGVTHYVIFNRVAGAPVEAKPLFRRVVYAADDLFTLTLRLITVAPPPEPVPEP